MLKTMEVYLGIAEDVDEDVFWLTGRHIGLVVNAEDISDLELEDGDLCIVLAFEDNPAGVICAKKILNLSLLDRQIRNKRQEMDAMCGRSFQDEDESIEKELSREMLCFISHLQDVLEGRSGV
ncbi:MAG: hypothetical protein ACXABY_30695 [Candidatus Thorarchaeota archaeon]|jgi:hypothetical protein